MRGSDAESGDIICTSCIPTGEPPTVDYLETAGYVSEVQLKDVMASTSGRFMADDGRVVFSSADRLAPADTNGKIDVYEFTENRPHLITTGTGERDMQARTELYPSTHTGLEGISADGTDIYFSTFETLVPQDGNGSFVKFYDARTGGGFLLTPPALPCSAADECHGDTSTPAPEPQVGTSGNLGSSAIAPAGKRHKQSKPHKRRHRGKRRKRNAQARDRGGRRG